MELTGTSNKSHETSGAIIWPEVPSFRVDTSHFCRALDHYRRTTGSSTPFHELPADQRSLILDLSQKLKLGLDFCEGADQSGRGALAIEFECSDLGTIYDRTNGQIVCSRHYREEQ